MKLVPISVERVETLAICLEYEEVKVWKFEGVLCLANRRYFEKLLITPDVSFFGVATTSRGSLIWSKDDR